MSVSKAPFGVLPDGTAVERYTLRAGALSCGVITYGGALQALRVPDRDGGTRDVVLGFDTLEGYRRQDKYIGALIGRYANRIGGARFTLGGTEYRLSANDGPNHLHGGTAGFDKRVWTVEDASEDTLALALFSPDGEEGYPGNLSVRAAYVLTPEGLSIRYHAEADRDTVCSLTNHSYFNLAGHAGGPVTRQEIQIFADQYTPADAGSIPSGEAAPVAGTPMDLREPAVIGAQIDGGFPQLAMAGGYDHNWILRGEPGVLRPAARASCAGSGIALEVRTTLPGIQFYTGNYLDGCPAGKGGAPYAKRWGFCLETQFFPDSPNRPEFPSCLLRRGESWDHETAFRFTTF